MLRFHHHSHDPSIRSCRRPPRGARPFYARWADPSIGLVRALGLLTVLLAGPTYAKPVIPDLEAVCPGGRHITLYWTPTGSRASLVVRRNGAIAGTVEAGASTWSEDAPAFGATYSYLLETREADGRSVVSNRCVERTDPDPTRSVECDVLVVGSTSAGVGAAVAASRYGWRVVLTEESRRLGGMPANGLGASDIRRVEDSSGLFEEFRRGVMAAYGAGDGLKYEPRVAHEVIKGILFERDNLAVYRGTRVVEVERRKDRVVSVTMEQPGSGARIRFVPRMVVDATDCGDVAARARLPYRLGREGRSAREPHAGVIYYDRAADARLPGSSGARDRRVQAYAYLMTVKDFGAGADRSGVPPPSYDPAKYRGAPKWDDSWATSSGPLPNSKFEINQHPYGSDLQGVNYRYAEADYPERRRIEKLFREHALGYLHYIQTVEGQRQVGLAPDEYRGTGGWPSALYVRESRRFDGLVRMDETDIMAARTLARPNAIGIGDYAMDSHAARPKDDAESEDMGEGEFYLPQYTPWHQVPYSIMVSGAVANLAFPTGVSATHVAYGTYRMEPVRMHLGVAAGVAAHLCLRYGHTLAEVPVRQIQEELLKSHGPESGATSSDGVGSAGPTRVPTILYKFPDVAFGMPGYDAIMWLGARGFYPCPPPAQRKPAAMLAAAPFAPDEPLTRRELARTLGIMASRAAQWDDCPETVRAWHSADSGDGAVSRLELCNEVATFMGWSGDNLRSVYADLPPADRLAGSANAVAAHGIDSAIWGAVDSYRTGGPRLEPGRIVTRRQWAQWLYLLHRWLGPTWSDHPADKAGVVPVGGAVLAKRRPAG